MSVKSGLAGDSLAENLSAVLVSEFFVLSFFFSFESRGGWSALYTFPAGFLCSCQLRYCSSFLP